MAQPVDLLLAHDLRLGAAGVLQVLLAEVQDSAEVRRLVSFGCPTRMHVVRLLAPAIAGEDHTKDIDFSARGIRGWWEAGYADTLRVLAQRPWTHPFDPIEGFILHETEAGAILSEG